MPEFETDQGSNESAKRASWILLLPVVLLVLVLFVSPNFRWADGKIRAAPYGGDFLQEWIGGQLVLSGERRRLYDLDFVKRVQHDRSRIGFEWSEQDYFPMVYPPNYYLLVSPFSKISYRLATIIWAGLSTMALVLTGILLYRFYPPCRGVLPVWLVAASVFVPWIKCLTMGQKSSFLLLLLTATFLLQYHRREFWAGLVFGFLVVKPQLGLAIGVAMVWKRQSEFVLGAVLMAGTLVGLSWMYEPELWLEYLKVVTRLGDYLQTGGYQLAESHSLWGATQLTFRSLDSTSVKWIAAVLAMLLVGCIGVGLSGEIRTDQNRYALQFASLVLATVMLSPHFYTYDLTILLLPMVLIVTAIGVHPATVGGKAALLLTLALYVLSGLFARLATQIGFQLSQIVMGGLVLALVICLVSGKPEPAEAGQSQSP